MAQQYAKADATGCRWRISFKHETAIRHPASYIA
jgi:hypothetical protein